MFFVDEAAIERAHEQLINDHGNLADHKDLVESVLSFIADISSCHPHQIEDDLVNLRLAIRCFNSLSSAFVCLRKGYYQPSLTLLRDIIETTFLLDLFQKDAGELSEWVHATEQDRKKNFSPYKVRVRLDEIDGFSEMKRAEVYKFYSTIASHANPSGFQITMINGDSQIGPFPNQKLFQACLEDIAKYSFLCGLTVFCALNSTDDKVLEVKAKFVDAIEPWKKKYFP